MRRARADAEAARGVGLRVEVDHEHRRARLREARGDVDRGRRLADAALLVRHCIDPRHRPDPTAAVGRIRPRASGRFAAIPGRRGKRSGVGRELADDEHAGAFRRRAPRPRARRPRTASSSPAASRDHSTSRPPGGTAAGTAPTATGGGASARATTQAQASRSAPRADVLGALGVHVGVDAERGGRLGDERGLARRRLDQVQLALGPHDRQHEARAARRRCRRPRAGPAARRRSPAGPRSASSTWRAAASAGSRIAVTPTGVAQTRSTSSARRSSCRVREPGAPAAMTSRARRAPPFHVKRAGACVT